MIYVNAYDYKAGKCCIMRARCRHCANSWFPCGYQFDDSFLLVYGQCHYPDDHVKRVVRGQLACDRFRPKDSIKIVGKEANQLSLFN